MIEVDDVLKHYIEENIKSLEMDKIPAKFFADAPSKELLYSLLDHLEVDITNGDTELEGRIPFYVSDILDIREFFDEWDLNLPIAREFDSDKLEEYIEQHNYMVWEDMTGEGNVNRVVSFVDGIDDNVKGFISFQDSDVWNVLLIVSFDIDPSIALYKDNIVWIHKERMEQYVQSTLLDEGKKLVDYCT